MAADATSAVREDLTRDEAVERARRIGRIETRVHLDLDRGDEVFGSETSLTFTVLEPGPTFLDLTARSVDSIELDGTSLDAEVVSPTRITLPRLDAGEHHLRIEATMLYRHEGSGLHRFVDPSDELVYLHSQFEPFDAHLVYACFDQPDLKTVFELTVDAPSSWVVVSNAEVLERPGREAAGRWRFAPTPVISPYITAVVAGSYTSVHESYERAGGDTTELGLYVRRSLAEHLDAQEVFDVTRRGLAAFERLFGQQYPFGKYDQLFVPEFSAGAMENPGCITFSESYIFRSKVTDALRERRAETILHEMAHMWFGDLVTMRWWDDLWLNESFATFMSVLVQATATRWRDAWVTFLDSEKAWAKFQDQLPSTHPIADAMPNVEAVHQNFDGITYAKGASVLRQLVAWVGQDEFIAGCRDYFVRHAWSNTSLEDFLTALEGSSGRDLAAWRDEWLLTTGLNVLRPRIETGDDGTYRRVAVVQDSPTPPWADVPGVELPPSALRRHRLAVGLYRRQDGRLVRDRRVELDVAGSVTEVPQLTGVEEADVLLLNDDDLTYAKVSLDPRSMEVVTAELARFVDPLPRAQLWSATWDMVRDAELSASEFVRLVEANVVGEDVGVLQRLLARAIGAAERYAHPEHSPVLMGRLARHARRHLELASPESDEQLAWVRHWASVAYGDDDELRAVRALFDGELTFEGLTLDPDLRWHLVVALARAGEAGEDLIAAELDRDDTDLGRRHAATARAARPTTDAKEAAWRLLLEDTSLSHTLSRHVMGGFAQLNDPGLMEPFVERYFEVIDDVWARRSLDWAIGFFAAVFPHAATGQRLLDRVDRELTRDDLPRPVRRVLLEQRDIVVRTIAARETDRVSGEPATA